MDQVPGTQPPNANPKYFGSKISGIYLDPATKQKRTPTKECLQKGGLKRALCSICNSEIESQDQLFLIYPLQRHSVFGYGSQGLA